jgi:response regulator RpfG family c-di-GMP phosphodiesterase
MGGAQDCASRVHRDAVAALLAAAAATSSPRATGQPTAALCARVAGGLAPAIVADVELAAIAHQLGRRIALRGAPAGTLTAATRNALRARIIAAATALATEADLAHLFPILASAHEHYDGTGYPGQCAGEEIPLGARIIAAVSALEAMRRPRDYRPPLNEHDARIRLATLGGSQLDPAVVTRLLAELRAADPLFQPRWRRS